ncbi:MAG: hypothetical protein ABJH98_17685 [Reichenbachiella sp.]|uniref:hypothetical protein n=1 Tax=Reichenbachiella sp. TaxID=2184521 RepID=UPI003298E4EB
MNHYRLKEGGRVHLSVNNEKKFPNGPKNSQIKYGGKEDIFDDLDLEYKGKDYTLSVGEEIIVDWDSGSGVSIKNQKLIIGSIVSRDDEIIITQKYDDTDDHYLIFELTAIEGINSVIE